MSKSELETKSHAELIKLVQELFTRVTKLELENKQLRTELENLKRKQARVGSCREMISIPPETQVKSQ